MVAFAGTFLGGLAGRDIALLKGLRERLGPRPMLPVMAAASAMATGLIASWLGAGLAGIVADAGARWLASAALAGAALRIVLPRRDILFREPTRSLGAIALVLFARQIFDAARLFAFGLALLAVNAPSDGVVVSVGVASGGAVAILAAWIGLPVRPSSSILRWGLVLAFVTASALIAFNYANVLA